MKSFIALLGLMFASQFFSASSFAADSAKDLSAVGIAATQPEKGPFVKLAEGKFMVPYTMKIPGTEVSFEMVPIPGGTFKMGSPAESKKDATAKDEGPQREVTVEPFWMSKYEVTWAEYHEFMALYQFLKKFETAGIRKAYTEGKKGHMPDAITAPTKLYDPSFTYENGEDPRLPAVTMTQYAAKQYTKWLSGITGHYYRLPCEAEWEYAARAGTTTPWFFGDEPAKLNDFAWSVANSEEKPHPVGQKQPNPWGLYDIYGNVAEWTLDQYFKEGYKPSATPLVMKDAIAWPTKEYPRALRGGNFYDKLDRVNSTSRMASNDETWKETDPNLPKSPWWYTDDPARAVGFRIIRLTTTPSAEEKKKVYDPDCDAVRDAVDNRLSEGRGVLGITDLGLPAAIQKVKEQK